MELIEATILAKGHQRWIDGITKRYGAKFRLLHSKPSQRRDEVLQLFEVTVDDRLKDMTVRYLQSYGGISELEVAVSSHGRIIGLIRSKGVITRCIADSDCFLIQASGEYGAPIKWKVLGTRWSLAKLMARLTYNGVKYNIADISKVKRRKTLTTRQEWVLRSAFELGYFDYPKRIRIRRLARLLGVSAPTIHESLRRTQRRLVEEHLDDESLPHIVA
ncbi:MAG: helix-turn-helix domain-containing protein [Nitrososphaerota archaeon]|jgi:predicted DNA binding protein|nr:helix-turn-helix domain-containing protein [Nitrososphaerota archaeon]MDG6943023.1 helix-turn-helix domain-containing protein [Nitrososphaerota archaeon]MDG6950752.1 helix-turn-helix domain-containing protein [Nitrososphaerota archaeon]